MSNRTCAACRQEAIFICSSCGGQVSYCSEKCQQTHWPTHQLHCPVNLTSNEQQPVSHPDPNIANNNASNLNNDSDQAANLEDDLPYYTNQVYRLIKPIMVCITLSILWTKISLAGSFRPASAFTVYTESNTASTGEQLAGGFANAGIIIGQIVGVTFVLFLLFKFNCTKIITLFFGLVMLIVLGFTGYLLTLSIIQVSSMVIDGITLYFGLYNFAVVGIVSIFWRSPRYVQQIYLVIMSSLMAFALTGLQEWTTWILLGLLAIWDLFAVLSPYGPLRLLVEHTRRNNQNIEMLVYSVGTILWFMATPRQVSKSNTSQDPSTFTSRSATDVFPESDTNSSTSSERSPTRTTRGSVGSSTNLLMDRVQESSLGDESAPLVPRLTPIPQTKNDSYGIDSQAKETTLNFSGESRNIIDNGQLPGLVLPNDRGAVLPSVSNVRQVNGGDLSNEERGVEAVVVQDEEGEEEESGLKLGLGDFVFYSVLTARAAMSDWVTTVACIVAVTTGMTMTIFILAIFRKPLPALPISIAFGMLFYFVSSITLQPFLEMILLAQIQI